VGLYVSLLEFNRSSSATKGIVAVKIEPITANEGCTRLWKSEIQFDGIFEGLGVQPLSGPLTEAA
jgi:hypothetical protein